MILYVNGQDIARFVLGVVGEEYVEIFDVPPEQVLASIANVLERRGASLEDVETIVCVQGPGSATALRVSLSVIQALAFTKEIPLIAIEKDSSVPDQEVFSQITSEWLAQKKTVDQIVPLYLHAPNITASTRDSLKRSN